MSTRDRNLSDYHPESIPDASRMKFGIIVSDYNQDITTSLLDACIVTLKKHGVLAQNIDCIRVPGSFELVSGADLYLQSRQRSIDAVICLGCVIKGETRHDEYINHAIAQGITGLNTSFHIPVIFGVLTTNTLEQALARAGGKAGNKGVESAIAAIRMANLRRELSK